MDLETIPDCTFEEEGVSFKYLAFNLKSGGAEKLLVRGVNFRSYEAEATERITNLLRAELDAVGFDETQDSIEIDGGGSVVLNPYYETLTIFGEDPRHGGESDRQAVAELFERTFQAYSAGSYAPGEEEAPPPKPKPKRKPAAKPAAARPAAKAVSPEDRDASNSPSGTVRESEAGNND